MRTRFLVFLTILLTAGAAGAGTHTNKRWSSEPSGNGIPIHAMSSGRVAFYNFDAATDSPVLSGAFDCDTFVVEVTGTLVIDIQTCDAGNTLCVDLPNGTDLAASGAGPQNGHGNIKVNVDTCTTCEGEVMVFCAGRN